MTTQLTLALSDPRQGRSRRNGTATEKSAAATCDAQRQRDQIMRLLRSTVAGWTPDELGERMFPQVYRGTVASRLAQMRSDGLVEPFGVRLAPSGRSSQVWFVKAGARVTTVATGEYL